MESNRTTELDELSQFIRDSKASVGSILKAANWDEKSTLQEKLICAVPKARRNEKDPFSIVRSSEHSVTLDLIQLQNILKTISDNPMSELRKEIPNTFDDLQNSFTRHEKLAIYEHCIARTGRLSEPEISVMIDETEGMKMQMTFAQIVAQKRDLKRRSLKYRTNKEPPLSQTEEIRNLIKLQMGALSQYFNSKIDQKIEISANKRHKGGEDSATYSKAHQIRSVSRDRNSEPYRTRDCRKNPDQCDRKKSSRSRNTRSRSRSEHEEKCKKNAKLKDSRL